MANAYLQTSKCPLCEHKADYFLCFESKLGIQNYFKCTHCESVHLAKSEIMIFAEEKKRYEMHNNDVTDERYQKFVSPITTQIIKDQKESDKGLDFGCGPGPVITYVLQKNGFQHISLFDPYFHPNPEALKSTYDFIVCCEVMEHFSNPKKEFRQLRDLLNTNAKFYGKTELLDENFDTTWFRKWWYKNDPTHCFFYSKKTLGYIVRKFNFQKIEIEKDYFILMV